MHEFNPRQSGSRIGEIAAGRKLRALTIQFIAYTCAGTLLCVDLLIVVAAAKMLYALWHAVVHLVCDYNYCLHVLSKLLCFPANVCAVLQERAYVQHSGMF